MTTKNTPFRDYDEIPFGKYDEEAGLSDLESPA